MVCKDCRQAGKLKQEGAGTTRKIASLHRKCKGGTHCPCQHRRDVVDVRA